MATFLSHDTYKALKNDTLFAGIRADFEGALAAPSVTVPEDVTQPIAPVAPATSATAVPSSSTESDPFANTRADFQAALNGTPESSRQPAAQPNVLDQFNSDYGLDRHTPTSSSSSAVPDWLSGVIKKYTPTDLEDNQEFHDIVAAGAKAESGFDPKSVQPNGGGRGTWQFDINGGMGTGASEDQLFNPNWQAQRIVPRYADAYRRAPAGLSAAEKASWVAAQAERPYDYENPNSQARQNYASAYTDLVGDVKAVGSVDRTAPDRRRSQFALGLSLDDAAAFCGPAAALAFAQTFGRTPTVTEAKKLAERRGWTQNGMAGIESEQGLLKDMGIDAKVETSANWQKIAQDAKANNPVIVSTPGHYFVVTDYKDGRYYVGTSGTDLRHAPGEDLSWMTLDQMQQRMGAVQGVLFADNPNSPTPSVATGKAQSDPFADLRSSFESRIAEGSKAVGDVLGGVRSSFETALNGPRDQSTQTPGNGFDPSHMQASTAPAQDVPLRRDARDVSQPQPTIFNDVQSPNSGNAMVDALGTGASALGTTVHKALSPFSGASEEFPTGGPLAGPIIGAARGVAGSAQLSEEYKAAGGPELEQKLQDLWKRQDAGTPGLQPEIAATIARLNAISGASSGKPYDQSVMEAAQRDPNIGLREGVAGIVQGAIAAPLAADAAPTLAKAAATAIDPLTGGPAIAGRALDAAEATARSVSGPVGRFLHDEEGALRLPNLGNKPQPPDPSLTDMYDMFARADERRAGPKLSEIWGVTTKAIESKFADDLAEINKLGPKAEEAMSLFRGRHEAVARTLDREVRPVLDIVQTKQQEANFNAMVQLRRDIQVSQIDPAHAFSGGVKDAADAQAQLQNLERAIGPDEWAKLQSADKLRQQALDHMLMDRVAVGIVKPEIAADLMAKQPYYNPTRLDEMIVNGELGAGRRKSLTTNQLKRLGQGSAADTEPPLQAFTRAIANSEYAVRKNMAAQAIVDALRSSLTYKQEVVRVPNSKLMKGIDIATGQAATIASHQAPIDLPGTISVMVKGERQIWKLPASNPEIEKAVRELRPDQVSSVAKVFAGLNTVAKAGYTTFSPYFVVRNTLADLGMAYLRGGVGRLKRVPEGWYIAALGKKNPYYNQLIEHGSGGAHFTATERNPEQIIREIRRTGGIISTRPRDFMLDVLAAAGGGGSTALTEDPNNPDYGRDVALSALKFGAGRRAIREASRITEEGTRIAGSLQMQSKGASLGQQALEYRRSTIDFSRMGSWIRAWNPVSLFLGARVGGGLQVARTLRDDVNSRWRMAGITSAAVGVYLLNRDHPEYDNVPQSVREQNLVAMLPWSTTEKPAYVAYPLRELASFAMPITHVLDVARGHDPQGWAAFTGEFLNTFTPGAPGGDASSAAVGLIPTPLRTETEVASNKSFFTGAAVTPDALQGVEPAERYTDRTSELAKALGKRFGIAPTELDYRLRQNLGGAGRSLQEQSNSAIGRPTEGTGNAALDQLLGGVVRQGGSQKTADKYSQFDTLKAQLAPQVADLLRESPRYKTTTRDEQVRELRQVETEVEKQLRDRLDIDPKTKDLGLPNKYRGVTDPKQTEEIDRALTIYRAWRADPRTAIKPTPEESTLARRYANRVNPAYTREADKRNSAVNSLDRPIVQLLDRSLPRTAPAPADPNAVYAPGR